jgi:hypothetical protein
MTLRDAGSIGSPAPQYERDDYARFRPLFAEALDPRLYAIEHLDGLLQSGRAQFWLGEDAAIVTEIRSYPTGARVIHGLVAAGDLDEIVDVLIPRAEGWARSFGCVLAIIESRPGWARALKARGYEPHQMALRKAL